MAQGESRTVRAQGQRALPVGRRVSVKSWIYGEHLGQGGIHREPSQSYRTAQSIFPEFSESKGR